MTDKANGHDLRRRVAGTILATNELQGRRRNRQVHATLLLVSSSSGQRLRLGLHSWPWIGQWRLRRTAFAKKERRAG